MDGETRNSEVMGYYKSAEMRSCNSSNQKLVFEVALGVHALHGPTVNQTFVLNHYTVNCINEPGGDVWVK